MLTAATHDEYTLRMTMSEWTTAEDMRVDTCEARQGI